ncbi:hypothetical protein IJ670_06340 [bacterium]|nr:hypothetical protein [bacterium]
MFKRLILTLVLLSTPCFALSTASKYSCQEFFDTVKLTNKQEKELNKIEKQLVRDVSQINAQILLKQMELAYMRGKNNLKNQALMLSNAIESLQGEQQELYKQKHEQVASMLSWSNKRKYLKYCSNI